MCKMRFKTSLCVLFLNVVFLKISSFYCSAAFAAPCPVRTKPATGPIFKCVCQRNFRGQYCQYKASDKSFLKVEAQWSDENSVIVSWNADYTYGKSFYVALRKVKYQNCSILFSKWHKGNVTTFGIRVSASQGIATYTAILNVKNIANFEIHVVQMTASRKVQDSMSVFLDSPAIFGRFSMNHVNKIWQDRAKPNSVHGAVFAVPALTVAIMLFIIMRATSKTRRGRAKWNKIDNSVNEVSQTSYSRRLSVVIENSCVVDIIDEDLTPEDENVASFASGKLRLGLAKSDTTEDNDIESEQEIKE